MRKALILTISLFILSVVHAQRITHNFQNVTMADALQLMNKMSHQYTINFIYNDLEDFRVTANIRNQSIPDAIRQLIDFYPISIAFPSDSILSVECFQKTVYRYKGKIIDENGQPAEYANITLLSTEDSTVIGNGVSNVSGYFVIPCQSKKVIARITYVGYKTIKQTISHTDMGIIRLTPDNYTVKGITVKGHKKIFQTESDRLQYIATADSFAKGLNGLELLGRVPLLDGTKGDLPSVIGKSSTHYLLNGRELPENMQTNKIRSLKAEDIERIEVITIPPSKYKAEANAGYINIVTKKDTSLGLRGDWSASVDYYEKWSEYTDLNLFYATKRLNISLDAGLWDVDGINDHTSEFIFSDHKRTTDFRRTFQWLMPSCNLLAQYQLSNKVSIGVMSSVDTNCSKNQQKGATIDSNEITHSTLESPSKPNFDFSTEAYLEWKIDSMGKTINLTYDYLNNYSKQDENITSESTDTITKIHTIGDARYRIGSWKLDFMLPFRSFLLETGLAYTSILNKSGIESQFMQQNTWCIDASQTNDYQYKEKTAAAYISMNKDWTRWGIKAGMRMEKTWTEGLLINNHQKNTDDYLHLFPTLHFNWKIANRSNLRLAYSMGISRPDFQNLNPFRYYYTSNSYFEGNPSLQPNITHNTELSYSNSTGIYAVVYENHENNAVAPYTYFTNNGFEATTIANCLVADKAGLYVAYQKDLLSWWNIQTGGEVFYYHSNASNNYNNRLSRNEWSGKLEINETMFLNEKHTLSMELFYNHIFPHSEMGTHYKTQVLFGGNIRYSLLENRLRLRFSFSDPFKQNISRGTTYYDSFTMNYTTNAHSRGISLTVSYSFGSKQVKNIYHESKNNDASRAGTRN